MAQNPSARQFYHIHAVLDIYLPVAYASIRSANFGSTIVVRDTWVTTSNGSDMLKESDSFAVVFILF